MKPFYFAECVDLYTWRLKHTLMCSTFCAGCFLIYYFTITSLQLLDFKSVWRQFNNLNVLIRSTYWGHNTGLVRIRCPLAVGVEQSCQLPTLNYPQRAPGPEVQLVPPKSCVSKNTLNFERRVQQAARSPFKCVCVCGWVASSGQAVKEAACIWPSGKTEAVQKRYYVGGDLFPICRLRNESRKKIPFAFPTSAEPDLVIPGQRVLMAAITFSPNPAVQPLGKKMTNYWYHDLQSNRNNLDE